MGDLRERRPRKSRLPHAPPEAGSQQEPSATRSIAAASQSPRGSPKEPLVPWPVWGFPGLTEALKEHNRRREPDFSLWSRRPGAAGSGRTADEEAIRPASRVSTRPAFCAWMRLRHATHYSSALPAPVRCPERTPAGRSRAVTAETGRSRSLSSRSAVLLVLLLFPDALEGLQVGLHVKEATRCRVALDGMASRPDGSSQFGWSWSSAVSVSGVMGFAK